MVRWCARTVAVVTFVAAGGLAVSQVAAQDTQDTAPVVTAVSFGFLSELPSGEDTHGVGDTIEIVVEFNEPVLVDGRPQLELGIGAATRTAEYDHVWDDGTGIGFHYQVQAEDRDNDGISIAANALRLNGATIRDSGGNDAVLDLGEHALVNAGDHKVNGGIDHPPVVTGADFESRPSGDTYGIGDRVQISVSFSESVTVTGTPQLELGIGTATRTAEYDHVWDDGTGIKFHYQVQAADHDNDGIGIAAEALKLNGATIRDSGGNDAVLDLGDHAIDNDSNHKVDGSIARPPVVTWVAIESTPAGGDTYGFGETIRVNIGFNESIEVAGTPRLELTIGAATRTMDLYGDWSEGLEFGYEVQAADLDSDGISVAANAMSLPPGAAIRNDNGTDAELDLGEHAISNNGDHKVDGRADNPPAVVGVHIDFDPQSGDTYLRGELISIAIEFSEPIVVTGSPRLTLSIGSNERTIEVYHQGDRNIDFLYEVEATGQR